MNFNNTRKINKYLKLINKLIFNLLPFYIQKNILCDSLKKQPNPKLLCTFVLTPQ